MSTNSRRRPPEETKRMRNVLAIAHKELRSYFASPIAYIVIGCFAALYGFFFSFILEAFIRQAMQAGMMGGAQPLNVNQQVIRPVFQNVTVIALFLLPMVTMRTYSEEKRSGTIELLLTSPVTDVQIVILFLSGSPEWKPIVTAYLGFLLFGACFVSLGLFISSLSKNQIVAGTVTFAVFLFLWIISWIGSISPESAKL